MSNIFIENENMDKGKIKNSILCGMSLSEYAVT